MSGGPFTIFSCMSTKERSTRERLFVNINNEPLELLRMLSKIKMLRLMDSVALDGIAIDAKVMATNTVDLT